jgi:hypothetical protein
MKRLLLAVFLTILMVSQVNAQSTLALQKQCADEAKREVSGINVELAYECHYNRKLDKCFIKIYYPKGSSTILKNIFDNKVIGFHSGSVCYVENKECISSIEFEVLIMPYMEE